VYPSIGEDCILIPHDMCYNGPTVADLIEEVYGALSSIVEYAARSVYIIERAILTPLNEDVDALNKLIMTNMHSQSTMACPHSTTCITTQILWCMGSNMAFTPLSS
jgi:hypothetical protein